MRRFFHPTTYVKVIHVAQIQLVQEQMGLLTTECRNMIKEKQFTGIPEYCCVMD